MQKGGNGGFSPTNCLIGVLFAFRIPKCNLRLSLTAQLTQDHMVRDMLLTDNTQRHRVCVRPKSQNSILWFAPVSRSIGIAVLAVVVTVELKGSYTCIAGQTRPRLTI